jgi:hypothetical protein
MGQERIRKSAKIILHYYLLSTTYSVVQLCRYMQIMTNYNQLTQESVLNVKEREREREREHAFLSTNIFDNSETPRHSSPGASLFCI